jgi:hypothetical protein
LYSKRSNRSAQVPAGFYYDLVARPKKDIDWDAIAAAYDEGSLTLKALGEEASLNS